MNSFGANNSVLIVEDDGMVLGTLTTTLELEHFDVTGCSNPFEALRLLSRREYAVILSDHNMPGMSGLAFFAECRRLHPASSRILLTAVRELNTVMAAINQGGEVCRFLSKPWKMDELIAAVRSGVQQHERMARSGGMPVRAAGLGRG